MRRQLLLLMFFVFNSIAFAQTVVSGHVKDAGGSASEGVLVTVFNPNDTTIIGYGFTDVEGSYLVEISEKLDSVLLQIQGFNVRKQRKMIAARTQTLEWTAVEESIALKEVQVKAEKLWGSRDTLNYLVSAYTRDHDVTIGDVLKQLPGISVEDNGTIRYQGMPISKFYIENMDVLQGRYAIATNGIKAEDVATVQVLENHQHVKALQDQTLPESAALNLKLKKDRGIWSGNGTIGAGYDDSMLYTARITEMRLGKKSQNVFYYGSNNEGEGSYMLQSHYDMNGVLPQVLTTVVYPDESPVGRSVRNNYHELSANNLKKLSDDKELHFDVAMHHDARRAEGYNRISYFMPDGSVTTMEEAIASRITDNSLQMNVTYEHNASMRYVKNTTDLVGKWNNSRGDVFGHEDVSQYSYCRTLGIHDRLAFVHRTENGGGYEVKSDNVFSVSPQALSVTPENSRQNVEITTLASRNDFSLLRNIRKHRLTIVPAAHVNATYVGAVSRLKGKAIYEHTDGEMDYIQVDAGVGPKIIYSRRDLNITANIPLSLLETQVAMDSEDARSRLKLQLAPSLNMTWKIAEDWSLIGNGNYGLSQNSWREMYSSYVLSNYRALTRYEGGIYDTESLSASVRSTYQNIMHEFFAWAEISVSNSKSDVMYGSSIDDKGYTTMQVKKAPHQTKTLLSRLNLRKDFDWKKTDFDVTLSYQRTSSEYLRQSVVTKYNFDGYGIAGKISITPFRRLVLYYNTDWSLNKSKTVEDISSETIEVWTNKLTAHLTLIKNRLFLSSTGSHQYNSILSGDKHHFFLDANIRIKVRNKSDLHLRATNLLNTKNYYSVENFDMMERYSEYSLLPRAIMLEYQINF